MSQRKGETGFDSPRLHQRLTCACQGMIAPLGFVNALLFAILCILRPYVLCSVVRCDAAKCIAPGDKSSASLSAPSVRESRYNPCLRPRVPVTVDGAIHATGRCTGSS